MNTPATCRSADAAERGAAPDRTGGEQRGGPGLSRRYWIGLLVLAVFLVVADLASKSAAQAHLDRPLPRSVVVIPNVLSLTYRENTGGPFSLLAGTRWSWLLGPLALVATAGVVWWVVSSQVRSRLEALACAVIVGGAVGNLIDRLWLGAVRDFLNLTCIHWPVFNLADTFICIGVALLLWELLVGGQQASCSERSAADQVRSSNT